MTPDEYQANLLTLIELIAQDTEAATEGMRSLGVSADQASKATEAFSEAMRQIDWNEVREYEAKVGGKA